MVKWVGHVAHVRNKKPYKIWAGELQGLEQQDNLEEKGLGGRIRPIMKIILVKTVSYGLIKAAEDGLQW